MLLWRTSSKMPAKTRLVLGSVEHNSQMMKGCIHTDWQQIHYFPAIVLWSPTLRDKGRKILNVTVPHGPNYHVKNTENLMDKAWPLEQKPKAACTLKSFYCGTCAVSQGARQAIPHLVICLFRKGSFREDEGDLTDSRRSTANDEELKNVHWKHKK